MVTWKKWIIRGVVTLVVLATALFALLVIVLDSLFGDMLCATSVFERVASPDGKSQAVLFEIDCGATTGFNRQVSIVSSDTDLSMKKPALGMRFFGADGEPEIRMTWLGSDRLEVQYPASAKVFHIDPTSKGVAIEYKQSR